MFPLTGGTEHLVKGKRKTSTSMNFHLVVLLSLAVFVAFYLLLVADLSQLTCTTSPKVIFSDGKSPTTTSPQSSRW